MDRVIDRSDSMFEFNTAEEYCLVYDSIRDGILFWRKRKQDAQGKICMQVNGEQTHYTVEECEYKIKEYTLLLDKVIATPHLEWNGDEEVSL